MPSVFTVNATAPREFEMSFRDVEIVHHLIGEVTDAARFNDFLEQWDKSIKGFREGDLPMMAAEPFPPLVRHMRATIYHGLLRVGHALAYKAIQLRSLHPDIDIIDQANLEAYLQELMEEVQLFENSYSQQLISNLQRRILDGAA